MAKTMNKNDPGVGTPQKGEHFTCDGCGMKLEITSECKCNSKEGVHFHCCGMEMTKDLEPKGLGGIF